MSEQEQQGTQYTEEQYQQVRKARHAVQNAFGKFHRVVELVEGVDTYAVNRLSRRSRNAMKGQPGYTQEQQVQRFDWVTENVEGIKAALASVEPTDSVDVKALELAVHYLDERVVPAVTEGRAVAAERDFASYKAWKDAKEGKRYGSRPVAPVEEDEDDTTGEEDEG